VTIVEISKLALGIAFCRSLYKSHNSLSLQSYCWLHSGCRRL